MAAFRRADVDTDGDPTIEASVGELLDAQAQAGQAAAVEIAAILKAVFTRG